MRSITYSIRHSRFLSAATILVVAGCASAGDRFDEGVELRSQGRFMEASHKFAEALEKDPDFVEARGRLQSVGDSAILLGLDTVEEQESAADPVAASAVFRQVDQLVVRAGGVGVTLRLPEDYDYRRRGAFDRAVELHFDDARRHYEAGRFRDAQRSLRRVHSGYETSPERIDEALNAEIDVLVDWAAFELAEDRYKASFELADQALMLRPSPSRSVVGRVREIQTAALNAGTLGIAVLPLTTVPGLRETVGSAIQDELSDNLELDYWRRPPPFVAVVDPVLVRREVREVDRASGPLTAREVARVLDRVGADLGALIEITEVEESESDVRREARNARLRRGGEVGYHVERGRLTVSVHVDVIIVDAAGAQIERFQIGGTESGGFERGVYRGNAGELELSRNEARYFDPDVIAGQRAEIVSAVLVEVAEGVGAETFSEVLERVR